MISGKTNYEVDDAENSFIKEVEPEYRSKPKHLFKNEHKKWINQGNALNFDISYSLLNLADNLEEKLMTIEKVIKLSEMEQYKEFFQSLKHEKQVEYVFNSNVGENVGHQSLNETSYAIQQYKEGKELNSNEYKETINTLKALNFLNETRCEMQASILIKSEIHHSIFLNEDIVKECHSILMEGLASNNGFYRKKQACTIRDNNTLHYYVDQELISNRCEGLIDYYNTNVDQFLPGYEFKIENLFKLASFLAFNFVDVHPFSDGNGRLARLLANHVLSLCLPFPVTFSKDRAEYISIIEKCRYSNTTWHLTIMLIDASFQFSLDILNRLK